MSILTRASLFILLQHCLLVPAEAADLPVTKPILEPKQAPVEVTRLPAPAPVIGLQRSDGIVEVRWSALEGALRYQLTRSSSGEAQRVIELPIGGPAIFHDSDIKQGSTYYYMVAGLNRAGVLGLKAGSQPVRAILPVGGGGAPSVTTVQARQEGPNIVAVIWSLPASVAFNRPVARVERIALSPPMPPRILTEVDARSSTFRDTTLPAELREVQYRVTIDGRATNSNRVALSGATTGADTTGTTSGGTGSTTSPTTSTTDQTAAAAIGSATFTATPPVTVRVGATIANAAGGGTRVLSLNEAVARVDAAGAITGVAPGNTHVVSLTGSEGSLRVIAVQVTVTN